MACRLALRIGPLTGLGAYYGPADAQAQPGRTAGNTGISLGVPCVALEPSFQRALEDRARGALVERDRITARGRVLWRHLDDGVDLVVTDVEAGKGMRHAGFRPQF